MTSSVPELVVRAILPYQRTTAENDVRQFIETMKEEGITGWKVQNHIRLFFSSEEIKRYRFDKSGSLIFYSPSNKSHLERHIMFKNLVEGTITTDGKRAHLVLKSSIKGQQEMKICTTMELGEKLASAIALRHHDYLAACGTASNFQRRVNEAWLMADGDHSGTIDRKEFKHLLKKLNVNVGDEALASLLQLGANGAVHPKTSADKDPYNRLFRCADIDNNGTLCYDEFIAFFERMSTISYVQQGIFNAEEIDDDDDSRQRQGAPSYTRKALSVTSLRRFLKRCQGEDISESEALALIQDYEHTKSVELVLSMTPLSFSMFIVDSKRNSWFDWRDDQVNPDIMNHPLHHYYISCSHNTYSTGSQLTSLSDCNMYRQVLTQGCRCVEIDIQKNDSNGEPLVYHKMTPTSAIPLRSVCQAIRSTAFVNNPYPVVISLEINTKEHKVIADIMVQEFGELLLTPVTVMDASKFTPSALLRKILLKWKRDSPAPSKDQSEQQDGLNQLKALITVFGEKHNDNGTFDSIESIEEATMESRCFDAPKAFARKNCRMMTRGFPNGGRLFFSTNMNPILFWACGVQMAAMNFQTMDEGMHLHEGFFRQNGRCGYVLKPKHLREEGELQSAWKATTDAPLQLKVSVLFGFQLHHQKTAVDPLDPFVEVKVIQAERSFQSRNGATVKHADEGTVRLVTQTRRTKSQKGNGFLPFWDEAWTFDVHDRHGAMLVIRIFDDEAIDKVVGEASICVANLALGFRAVPIIDSRGNVIESSSLVCHFAITEK